MTARSFVPALLALALVGVACAPDPLDTYRSADDTPATLPMPPTTTAASAAAEPEPAATFRANGATVEVRALDNSFIAPTVEIEAGTEVRWTNRGRNDHNVLPVDESLDWGVERNDFRPTDVYAHLFDLPGVYPYYCSIHGTTAVGMTGAIVVTEPT